MKIAICDDNLADLNVMVNYCRQFDASMHLSTYQSTQELLDAYDLHLFDIVLMDIEMPSPNGYEAAVELSRKENPPVIIFTTQSLGYAVRGYGIALRYLPKPISYEVLAEALQAALKQKAPTRISLSTKTRSVVLVLSEVLFLEVFRHNVLIHLTGQRELSLRHSFSELLQQLPETWFVQVHKSYCVNLNHILQTQSKSLLLTDGSQIPIGRSFAKSFQERLMNFLKGQAEIL